MNITFTVGAWLIPLALTIIFFLVAKLYSDRADDPWGMIKGLMNLFAVIASLVAWLIWALLR